MTQPARSPSRPRSPLATSVVVDHAYLHQLLQWLDAAEDGVAMRDLLGDLEAYLVVHFQSEEGPGGLFSVARERAPERAAEVDRVQAEHAGLLADARRARQAIEPTVHAVPEAARVYVTALGEKLRAHERAEGALLAKIVRAQLDGAAEPPTPVEPDGELPAVPLPIGALSVADLMTMKVHHLRPDDTLRDVHGLMKMAGIRHVPIVDEQQRLVGLVSDRDVQAAWTRGLDTPVARLMTRNVHAVFADTPALDAAGMLLQRKIGCLPVVLRGDKLVGIVTETDFLTVAHRALTIQKALGMLAG